MTDTGKSFELEILTPLKSVFKGQVEYVMATGADGLFGVLINHAPMLSGLGFGPMKIRSGGQDSWFVLSDGFFEIRKNVATLLVDTAEAKENIDVKRAEAAKDRAMKRLHERQDNLDVDRARAALHRALTRLSTVERR